MGFDGKLTRFCSKVFDGLVLGLLWLLCCIPVVTAGVSCAALYHAAVKCIKKDRGYAVEEFFHSFRQNLKPGFLLWCVFLALIVILNLNIGILTEKTSGYAGLFGIVFYAAVEIYLILAACYAFPALSRFDMGAGWIMKLSLFMVVRYFFTSLALALVLVCFGAVLWRLPVLILVIPTPAVLLASEFLERVLKKHEPS